MHNPDRRCPQVRAAAIVANNSCHCIELSALVVFGVAASHP